MISDILEGEWRVYHELGHPTAASRAAELVTRDSFKQQGRGLTEAILWACIQKRDCSGSR